MDKKVKLIVTDDGSTSTKLAWFDGDVLRTLNVSNSAEFEKSFSDSADNVLSVGGVEITFFEAAESESTNNSRYQYGDHSVAAVHHALHEAGFSGTEVSIIATLPIREFYDENNRKNQANIDRKKANLMREVSHERCESIKIVSVKVFPEGIPAVFHELSNSDVYEGQLTFLADMGGTTLDLCLFSGSSGRIQKAASLPIGMFGAFEEVRRAIGQNIRPVAIKEALQFGHIWGGSHNINREEVTANIMRKAVNEIVSFIGDDHISRFYCIGGGAELLTKALHIEGFNPKQIEKPVEALATALAIVNRE